MNNEEKILDMLEQLYIEQKSLKQSVTKIEVAQENVIIPQIRLLAEGHTIIQDQIKRLSIIDAMQDDIATLKSSVRYLSGELEKLKSVM